MCGLPLAAHATFDHRVVVRMAPGDEGHQALTRLIFSTLSKIISHGFPTGC